MTLARTSELVERARRAGTAVPAFNVITIEHAEGVLAGAERTGCPVILQVSENAVRYHNGRLRPILAACRELAIASEVAIALHLDHLEDEDLVLAGIVQSGELGVSSLMVDASRMPYDDNVLATALLAARAREAGLWVEAELGEIGGKDGAHAPGVRTDPEEAAGFVRATGVDGLAVAVGSSHAMTSRDAVLDVDLISRLARRLTIPLVLHGSSGVPNAVLRDAVKAGIRKVNIGTALNVGFTGRIREFLASDPAATDPRSYLRSAREAVAIEVAELCAVVGG
ncbi:fructose-bisphosphate aldolase class II [Cryobacterium mesophilum]|uniref:Class II fructose-bisphosphate aldolase n=1 Tax=Terrimesophilobacter mesophilus TaxID=433647 RepID=A0A4R8V9S8_9MICO|nr:class II fructose-bisphosphate aldolase [Terrimesophilobacter mesophilus]MBB5632823.1 fructose-bisphosphate aldolase class II [Terrimesophilobacter mesophilus]TFB79609.1 class II fructose-bisphosphate aldolase [Terrimesophilobacter mesophilus]